MLNKLFENNNIRLYFFTFKMVNVQWYSDEGKQ